MGRKKMGMGEKLRRRRGRLEGSKEKAEARILANRHKKIKKVEDDVAEQLRKLGDRHKGYLRGVKHLSAEHKTKISKNLKGRMGKNKTINSVTI